MSEKVLVAKSYENLPQIGEPYTVSGKTYIKVRMKNGTEKAVKVYTEVEYNRYYPEVKIIKPAKSRKDVLGFGEAGYITLFVGKTSTATYENLDWFHTSPCRYARPWGWYLPSDIEMPEPLPMGITTVQLNWDTVSKNGQLLPEEELTKVVESLIYEPGKSEFIGEVGDRIEVDALLTRAITNTTDYGISYFFIFQDEDENVYTWTTSTRPLKEGIWYHVKGTVKDHVYYHNNKQSVLIRCKVEALAE